MKPHRKSGYKDLAYIKTSIVECFHTNVSFTIIDKNAFNNANMFSVTARF